MSLSSACDSGFIDLMCQEDGIGLWDAEMFHLQREEASGQPKQPHSSLKNTTSFTLFLY